MQNIFKYIFLPLLLIYLIFLVWKTYFGDPNDLEKENSKLKENNKTIQFERDSLKLVNIKLKAEFDSVYKVTQRLEESIKKSKAEYDLLKQKSKRNLDSLNKWKNIYYENEKKLEEIRKNQKESTNQETLDFFKKY